MQISKAKHTIIVSATVDEATVCYHCGIACKGSDIAIDEKKFCCDGCKLVYEIISENGLCDYYKLENHPGLSQVKTIRQDKYNWLDNDALADKLYRFTDGNYTIITLYVPGVHCSSCMWLLEHLGRMNDGITESRLNFSTKEITIRFYRDKVSLRQIVELMATIGYEPYISLNDEDQKNGQKPGRARIYKLGVAGFCFANIMMMSFPEYLAGSLGIERQYASLFRILNLLLSVPSFFYCGSEFFAMAWKGLRQKMLNIDAPIALALIITYARSIYEITTGTGAGYLDTMSGIVFFMLIGRVVQERTYRSISFHRDYKAYFPIAVSVWTNEGVISKSLKEIKEHDIVQVHNEEIVPADAMVLDGRARIDYSFVTGESELITVEKGQMAYAGGRQVGEQIKLEVIKPVAGSYLTSLWNHQSFKKDKAAQNTGNSVIHSMAKYFTYVLFLLAAATALYWWMIDPAKILPSVSAMLIVACPCALLLSATFTNGSMLRIFSNNGLYLRDASVIEQMEKISHVVFDKTGTLTEGNNEWILKGHMFTVEEKIWVYNVAVHSRHPYSKALARLIGEQEEIGLEEWKETTGKGVEGIADGVHIRIGSADFTGVLAGNDEANMYIRIGDRITLAYARPVFRKGMQPMIKTLAAKFKLSLLSGDNDKQRGSVAQLFGTDSEIFFQQKPTDKLQYIENLQRDGAKVLMIGDGLNDAGALQQSDVGITLADDVNNFAPSCDAILAAKDFTKLPKLMALAGTSRTIITTSFIISLVYNIVGLCISMQGLMNPLIAAILMPLSTISIVLITVGLASIAARGLHAKNDQNHLSA